MKKKLFAVILLFALVGCEASNEKKGNLVDKREEVVKLEVDSTVKENPKAWKDISWGSNFETVSQKLSVAPVLIRGKHCDANFLDRCETYEIEDYLIGTSEYTVLLSFVDDQLSKIIIKCDEQKGDDYLKSITCFDNYSYLLEQKHGFANISTKEVEQKTSSFLSRKEIHKKEWDLDYQYMKMKYIDYASDGGYFSVVYRPNPKYGFIKLKNYEDKNEV